VRYPNRWVKGQSGNPKGRPKKAQELAILDAIRATFPPEQIAEYLQAAMRIAHEQNSARGMMAVLEFAAGYALGKPVQRIQQESGGLAEVLDLLPED